MAHPLIHLWVKTEEGWGFPCSECGKLRVFASKKATSDVAGRVCNSCSKLGRPTSEKQKAAAAEHAKKMGEANKGRKASTKTRSKLSVARQGKKPALGMKHTTASKAAIGKASLGHVVTPVTRKKMSASMHRRYGTVPNPNKPTVKQLGRWAYKVIKRDGATCQICGFKKDAPKTIVAHHVFSKARHPKLALNVNNGITLCVPCHQEEHSLNGIV